MTCALKCCVVAARDVWRGWGGVGEDVKNEQTALQVRASALGCVGVCVCVLVCVYRGEGERESDS